MCTSHGELNGADARRIDLEARLIHLTRQQARVLAAVAVTGDRVSAGELLGLSSRTVANHLDLAFERLDVQSVVAAFRALDWLDVPTDLLDVEVPPTERPFVWLDLGEEPIA